jgi:hypothetical protein
MTARRLWCLRPRRPGYSRSGSGHLRALVDGDQGSQGLMSSAFPPLRSHAGGNSVVRLLLQVSLIDDEPTMLGDSVIEPAGRGVRRVCPPVQLATAVLTCPGSDVLDQRSTDPVAAGPRIGEQILQVADVGGVRVGVREKMRDPDQSLVVACAAPVNLRASLQAPPGSVVFLVG